MKYIFISIIFILSSCSKKDPESSALFEKGSIFIINGGENSISVIDLQTLEEKNRFFFKSAGNTFAHHIYMAKDFSKISVAFPEYDFSGGHSGLHGNNPKGFVGILNLKDQSEKHIPLAFANHNAVFSNDLTEIWTALVSHSGKIQVFDAESFTSKKEISVGPDPTELIFAKNGELALIAAGETSFLTVIDTKKKEVVKEIKVDPFPTNVWPGWNQSTVFVENANAKSLNIVDLANFKVSDFIDFDFVPGFTISNTTSNELWVCAPKINKVIVFQKSQNKWLKKIEIRTDIEPHQVAFLKDDKTAFVVNQKGNSVQVVDMASKKILKKINVGLKPNGIAIWE
jgi:YVTN family beta-propeller protein